MNLELNDVQAEALSRELSHLIENDRYPLSPRIVALKEILGMLRPGTRSPGIAAPATAFTSRRARADTGDEVSIR